MFQARHTLCDYLNDTYLTNRQQLLCLSSSCPAQSRQWYDHILHTPYTRQPTAALPNRALKDQSLLPVLDVLVLIRHLLRSVQLRRPPGDTCITLLLGNRPEQEIHVLQRFTLGLGQEQGETAVELAASKSKNSGKRVDLQADDVDDGEEEEDTALGHTDDHERCALATIVSDGRARNE